ncbi:MAG: WD-40 repeat-containing protein [Rhodospirillaceae bacterium]|nr:MAG: WD-40 repeat-containing protein [Rhodospirillaceae bacterium]
MSHRIVTVMAILATGVGMAACEHWSGAKEDPPLPGQRISVVAHERTLKPHPGAPIAIVLPRPRRNESWPQAGGYAQHAMHHLEIAESLHPVWRGDGGRRVGARDRLLASPIVVAGRIYGVDANAMLWAIDTQSGARTWSVSLRPEGEESDTLLAGGIAHEDGRLFVTTGWGEVVALRIDTGAEIWRRSVGAPVRAAPTVSGGRVFVLNKENDVRALVAENGTELWRHQGLAETTTLLGAAAPAVEGSTVVVALSSGELIALRAENGNQLWSDSLAAVRRIGAVANLTDILALPVIDRGRVYAVGHSGVMVAIDLRSGRRLWEVEMGGAHPPWIAGDFLFVLTNDGDLVAVEARNGRVAWVSELPRWEDPEDLTGRIHWVGPVLAGDRLIVAGSHEKVMTVSPYTGALLGEETMSAKVTLAPVVADGTLYFLTDDGDLVAYR